MRKLPSRPAADARPMLTVQQAAERLGYCERQVRRWIAAGALPTHSFGRSIRIAQADCTTNHHVLQVRGLG